MTIEQDNALQGLLQNILAEPESDDLRYIYADLLEDIGKTEHANFIRLQLEIDKLLCTSPNHEDEQDERTAYSMYCHDDSCKHCMLEYESYKAVSKSDIWAKPYWVANAEFRRGFVWSVSARFENLLNNLSDVLLQQPIQYVHAIDKQPRLYTKSIDWDQHVTWFLKSISAENSSLSTEIWNKLKNNTQFSSYQSTKDYPTEQEAYDALSNAILELARETKLTKDV